MRFGVDPWPRIDFYVRTGLVLRRPTPEQLAEASKLNTTAGFAIAERMKHFLRHPAELIFPTKRRKQALLRMTLPEMVEGGKVEPQGASLSAPASPPLPRVDRALRAAYQFAPLRFATSCYFNPYIWPVDAVATTGLTIPLKSLISHVCHEPHYTALWDVQIIHGDEGGLDQLEREIELAATGRGLKPRLYRAMTQSSSYYDYLRDLVPRVRRFDYPPPPPSYGVLLTNLVDFLNHAATL
jgi:hypothetical protein